MLKKIKPQRFWSPYLQAHVNRVLGECETCTQFNIRKGISTPLGQMPLQEGPFKHFMIDYVDMMRPIQNQRYMLVIVARFSRWVEAVPATAQNTANVIKFLTREVFPRFGVPTVISSDNGTVCGKYSEVGSCAAKSKMEIGMCVSSAVPRDSGKGQQNRKAKIAKVCRHTGLNWVDTLPLALMAYRMQTHSQTHLTPHEMMTMPCPNMRGPYEGPPLEQLQRELQMYVRQMSKTHQNLCLQEQHRARQQQPEEVPENPVQPGDRVYIRSFRRRWNEPIQAGPFEVTHATPTAVKVRGSNVWYQLNHCTRILNRALPEPLIEDEDGSDEETERGDSEGERDPEGPDNPESPSNPGHPPGAGPGQGEPERGGRIGTLL